MSLRLLLPLAGWLLAALLLLGAYWEGRSRGSAVERQKTVAALERAAGAEAEAELAQRSAARVDLVVREQAAATDLANDYGREAVKAKDADDLLPNDRVARLRDADSQLCQLSPELDGCSGKSKHP